MTSENGHHAPLDAAADGYFPGHYDAVLEHYSKAFQGLSHEILHEMESVAGPPVHIHIVSPPDVEFRLLLTEGMSAGAMNTLIMEKRFTELSLIVPRDIHFTALSDPETHPHGWIIHMLRYMAKFPHLANNYVDYGHIVLAGNEDEDTWGPATGYNAAVLLRSVTLWDDFLSIPVDGNLIRVLSVFPLYAAEVNYRMENGLPKFLDKITEVQLSEQLTLDRPNFG
jgi:Suppressor of fused protein (SUFU)